MVDTVYTQRRGSSLPYANAYGIGGTPTAAPAAVNTNPRKLRTYEDLLRERQGLQSNTLAGNIYGTQDPQATPRYGSEQGPYTGPVPMLPPRVQRIGQAPTVAPAIDPKYRAQEQIQEAAPQEAPQSAPMPPSQPEVVQQVDSLGNNVRPTDSPSSASLHDSYMSKVRGVLGSDNPQLEWQKQKDNPFWQRNDAYAGLVGVGLSLLSGATPMEAFQNAEGMRKSQMVQDQIDQNMDYLLQKYTPDSVAAAKASGDMSLLKEKGISDEQKYELAALNAQFDADLRAASEGDSWNPIGDGYVVNKRTGEIKRAEGYGASASTGSGDVGQLQPYKDESGVWMVPSMNKGRQTGEFQIANAAQSKSLSEAEASQSPDANEIQQSKDFARLRQLANEDQVGTITGSVAQWDRGADNTPGALTRFRNVMGNDAENEAAQVAARIDGRMRSSGVADAKAMGASGINTAAEAELYFQGMPRLNYSSKAALLRSLDEIEAYTADFNAKKRGQSRQGALSQSSNSFDPSQVKVTRNQ